MIELRHHRVKGGFVHASSNVESSHSQSFWVLFDLLAKTESFGAVYQSMCLTVCMQFAVVYISRAGNLLPGKRQKLWKEATEWFFIRLCIVDGHIACMKNQVDVVIIHFLTVGKAQVLNDDAKSTAKA